MVDLRIGYPDKAEPSVRRGRKVAVSEKMAELPKDMCRDVRLFFLGKGGSLMNAKKEVISMATALKQVECDPKCGFMIRSHDEKEVIEIAKEHAKKSHNMTITEKEIKAMMKNA